MLSRWAIERAMFANANPRIFRSFDQSGRCLDKPFEPAHFLGEKTREAPKRADPLKEYNDKMAVVKLNAKLGKIVKGAPPPEGLDDIWTRPYEGKPN